MSWDEFYAFLQVVWVDLALAGDNAIVVGMAAAGLPALQRRRAIAIGIGAAVVLRIAFALVTTELLQIVGLLFAGGLLLLWVAWKLWREIAAQRAAAAAGEEAAGEAPEAETKPFRQAVLQIVVADISMSLDNVLAVAGVAREHAWVLIFGLALSVALMALAANLIAGLLKRHPWIAFVGLAVILYVAGSMIYEGGMELWRATRA